MKLYYRPEIDGLRGIAVLAVILYHSKVTILDYQIFKGGFIGVDIFFVISGYLITSIILNEQLSTGSFSFKYFFERRIRRIIPVLIFIMLVSLPFAWNYLLPDDFLNFSKSILYSLGFSSNFYFHYSGQQYGSGNSFLNPFLHTWSLSVEEQFYILFPILLLIAIKFFRKFIIHILILGFIISLGFADWGSRNNPSLNFYILPARAWELLAGSILAYFEIINGHRSKNKTLNLILPSVGLIIIVYSILCFKNEMFHPSIYTLFPIIGVCLIIWFSEKNELTTKILSIKLFVGIGLISYSLYLWHFPFFAFNWITEFTMGSLFYKLSLLIILIILSIFSYYFIERPARNKNNRFRVIISLIVISISILIALNIYIIQKEGFKDRIPEILQKDLKSTWDLLENLDGETCHENPKFCKFNSSSNKKIYIIGDSHMSSIMFDLKERVVKYNFQFVTSTIGGCLYYPGFNRILIKTQKIDEKCNNNYFQKLKETLFNEKNSIIIFGGRLPLHLSNDLFNNQEGGIEGNKWKFKYVSVGEYDTIENSFKNEILKLSKNNKIILVYPIPEIGWDFPNKLWNLLPKNSNLIKDYLVPKNYLTTSYKVYKNRTKSSFELLDSLESDNIYRVYPHTIFCDTTIKNRCITHDNKSIFYYDKNHLSDNGAKKINNLIIEEIQNIEIKSK